MTHSAGRVLSINKCNDAFVQQQACKFHILSNFVKDQILRSVQNNAVKDI